jgi:hypothetical protein
VHPRDDSCGSPHLVQNLGYSHNRWCALSHNMLVAIMEQLWRFTCTARTKRHTTTVPQPANRVVYNPTTNNICHSVLLLYSIVHYSRTLNAISMAHVCMKAISIENSSLDSSRAKVATIEQSRKC